MKIFKAVLTSLIALALIICLNTKFGDIPPLGKFLDPFDGFWANAENVSPKSRESLVINGLRDSVDIRFDEQMIPHISASNNYDLYFSQGFITAKDRLWQMDFQTRFASGRLSEVVGSKAIELDRYQRRMGMLYGAENMVREMMKDPEVRESIEAYTAGINAFIKTLDREDYPIEFKLLDYEPEDWKPVNCGLLLKLMSATLAGGSDEFYMSNILAKYGPDVTKDLFPDYPYREDPIIPENTTWDFQPVTPPSVPETLADKTTQGVRTNEKREGIGSNNWALSGSKTASGFPLLANDPHLDLTLPAIWYQIQLMAPGINTYGVSIPGAPGVIIGFNEHVAWGVTNVGADVLDWYSIRFRDSSRKEYWHNNKWNSTTQRVEEIHVRGGSTYIDTVYYTHHGPVVYTDKQRPADFAKISNVPTGHALRWVAHDASNDTRTFYLLNRAKNYDDYRKALTYFSAPAQNFVFASTGNDIAITPNGFFPLKYNNQGKFILDGTDPRQDWYGRIPADQNPTVKNPPRGFVSSANQSSTAQDYPYYINWEFSPYERAHRINKRLAVMSRATVDSMRTLQNDNYSIMAENLLDTLTSLVNPENLNASQQNSLNTVKAWDKYFNADAVGASIFDLWQKILADQIWADEFGSKSTPMRYPSRDRTVQLLLTDGKARWYDNINTPARETRDELINIAFKLAVDSLERKFGPENKDWAWGRVKQSHVPHLAKIAGFGSGFLFVGGSKTSVNAMSETNGPSWRMVVELGRSVKGYGVFPGGQSGNPGSPFYDDMITTWSEGRLNELVFLRSARESHPQIKRRWVLYTDKD